MRQPKFMPEITKDDFYAGNFPAEVKDQEDGAVIIPAKDGRGHWTHYMDGSGNFTSPHGNKFFSYDMISSEIFKNGQYEPEDFKKGWMDDYENLYSREYEPAEKAAMAMLKKRIAPAYGIMADSLPRQTMRDAAYMAIDEKTAVSAEKFREIQAGMETACDLNGRDRCVRPQEASKVLKQALDQKQPDQDLLHFDFENRHFALDTKNFIDIQSIPDFIPYSKRQHIGTDIESDMACEQQYE